MPIPDFQTLMRPVLLAHEDGNERSTAELRDAVADAFDITEAERQEMIPSGRARLFDNRIGWTLTHLSQAGALERTRRGHTRITSRGRDLLAKHPERVDMSALDRYAEYNAFRNRGTLEDQPAPDESNGPAVWMIRAGRGGQYAPVFVRRSAATVGWGATGDIRGLSRDELMERVKTAFPQYSKSQLGSTVNLLVRFARTMADGDVVLTPEPATRTILFGRIAGDYVFLSEPIETDTDHQHLRPVRWFARVSRDELSYGARNSLGSLMALTQPGHAGELLQLADAHADDSPPAPMEQRTPRRAEPDPIFERVTVPATASVPARVAPDEFETHPRRLIKMLDDLRGGQLALPDFQRSFVWSPDATRELIVSMIRTFPAGALLFLRGGGAAFQARPVEGAPALTAEPLELVLDGQQRLTSLYQALLGVGTSRFFLDIGALISGGDVNDAVRVFSAERATALEPLDAQAAALMMPLAAMRGSGASDWRDDVIEHRNDEDHRKVRSILKQVEQAFIKPLVDYAFPVTVLPQSTELEAVCTIFETLNRTGKPLTPFELISARAFAGGHSLRDLWDAALEAHPILADFDIDPYYVLQVIALRVGASCQRREVVRLDPADIAREWDDACADTASAVQLLRNECGVLVGKWLPYRPMLIPLAATWRDVESTAGPERGARRAKLKRWFWCACFKGEYESSSATLAERDTPAIRSWLTGGDEPPGVSSFEWDASEWRRVTVRQKGLYRATIALMLTEQPRDFHTGAPLTQDVIAASKVDDHHVFPRGYLKDIGRPNDVDSVLNHCLIDRETNGRIGKKPPSHYLGEIRSALGDDLDDLLASHRLPIGERSPLESDDFDEFLSWRLEELADALAEQTGQLGVPADKPDPFRSRLDAKVEVVELSLRRLVAERLDGDHSFLPPHVTDRVQDRVAAAARKLPEDSAPRLTTLDGQLEYFDLRELQDVITFKSLWPRFEPTFRTKETLAGRFGQLAELRNAIRHSRTLTDVAIKDGEAAILWFDGMLGRAES
ncbi:MAG TPA: winged helix-turn-helix domain-containing protein [Solirubrobacteraceae bacterium]|nr:winged helix-turn-helix domain-containing protein [Solirubrobacteraceae bacterium]